MHHVPLCFNWNFENGDALLSKLRWNPLISEEVKMTGKKIERCVCSVNERKINQTHPRKEESGWDAKWWWWLGAEIILSQVSFIYSKIQLLHGRKVVLLLLLFFLELSTSSPEETRSAQFGNNSKSRSKLCPGLFFVQTKWLLWNMMMSLYRILLFLQLCWCVHQQPGVSQNDFPGPLFSPLLLVVVARWCSWQRNSVSLYSTALNVEQIWILKWGISNKRVDILNLSRSKAITVKQAEFYRSHSSRWALRGSLGRGCSFWCHSGAFPRLCVCSTLHTQDEKSTGAWKGFVTRKHSQLLQVRRRNDTKTRGVWGTWRGKRRRRGNK